MSQLPSPAGGHTHPSNTPTKLSGGKSSHTPATSVHNFKYENPGGERALSSFSKSILDSLRRDAGIHQLIITSVARTPRRQAEIMYEHEQDRAALKETLKTDERRILRDKAMIDPHDPRTVQQYRHDILTFAQHQAQEPVNYKGEGGKVQATARKGLAGGENRDATINKMTARIISAMEKGHSVSTHLGRNHLEVADISLRNLTSEQQKKLLNAIRNRFHRSVYRLGHPHGPRGGQGLEFNDHDCFHVEILQVEDFDANQA